MTRTCSSRTDSSFSSQHKRQSSLDPAFDFRLNGELTTSPSEIQIAEVAEMKKPSKSPVIYPELDRYRNIQRPSDSSDNRIEVPVRESLTSSSSNSTIRAATIKKKTENLPPLPPSPPPRKSSQ
ncbi:hypothetical protein BFJ63_vAg17559 [Fusarium oxysporum f. sp. narcissi]|uniref:Uncharacterized protein n=1 Tax=Fusarium oxysporum f. sp. narcissi TaxID=451672 RepID=A0A4Q2UZG8_FUSOX|nr:hypothetical protein BFJ63_vAg17559 [Fusarium oxysporum f. sp. narcissi]